MNSGHGCLASLLPSFFLSFEAHRETVHEKKQATKALHFLKKKEEKTLFVIETCLCSSRIPGL
jgi:hypothetical protein